MVDIGGENIDTKENLEKDQLQPSEKLSTQNRMEQFLQQTVENWKTYKSTTDNPEILKTIDDSISSFEKELSLINTTGDLDSLDIEEINRIAENIDAVISDNSKAEIETLELEFNERKAEYDQKMKNSKENMKGQFLKALPEEILNKDIGDGLTVRDLVENQISMSLKEIGSELNQVSSRIQLAKQSNDPNVLTKELLHLRKQTEYLRQDPADYLNALVDWDDENPQSSKIVADLKEYIWSLNFLFSEESVEEKLGITIPKGFKNTKKVKKKLETILRKRFREEMIFMKKYKSLNQETIKEVRADMEEEFLVAYLTDSLNSKGDSYSTKEVAVLLDYGKGKKTDYYKKEYKVKGEKNYKAIREYNRDQKKLIKKIRKHPEIMGMMNLQLIAESKGERRTRITTGIRKSANDIQKTEVWNDPRVVQFHEEIKLIARSCETEEGRNAFFKKHGEKFRDPQGIANILYNYERLILSAGNDIDLFNEMLEEGEITFEFKTNDKTRRGDEYYKSKIQLTTRKTNEEKEQMRANELVLINLEGNITANYSPKTEVRDKEQTDFGAGRASEIINKIINKFFPPKALKKVNVPRLKASRNFSRLVQEGSSKDIADFIVGYNGPIGPIKEDLQKLKPMVDDIVQNIANSSELGEQELNIIDTIGVKQSTISILSGKKIEAGLFTDKIKDRKYASNGDWGEKYLTEGEFDEESLNNNLVFQNLKNPDIELKPEIVGKITEDYEEIRTKVTDELLDKHLRERKDIQKEDPIFAAAFENRFEANMKNQDKQSMKNWGNSLRARGLNFLDIPDRDILALEKMKLGSSYLETYIENHSITSVNKGPFSNIDFTNEETRGKAQRLLSIMELSKSAGVIVLEANLKAEIARSTGVETIIDAKSDRVAEIALGLGGGTNYKEQIIAIEAFTKGIFMGKNPKGISDFKEQLNMNLANAYFEEDDYEKILNDEDENLANVLGKRSPEKLAYLKVLKTIETNSFEDINDTVKAIIQYKDSFKKEKLFSLSKKLRQIEKHKGLALEIELALA